MRRTIASLVAMLAVALLGTARPADAAAFLWISAPTWSYSAAAAASPAGAAYFWGLSVGAGSFSYAYAYSFAPGGAAVAFAVARAGFGGAGAAYAAGLADPYADIGIDTSLPLSIADISSSSNETSDMTTLEGDSSNISSSYTITDSGITFTGNGSELHGVDAIQAFLYTGETDATTLCSDLSASSGCDASPNSTSTGDVTNIADLTNHYFLSDTLIPLDSLNTDPSSLSGLTFNSPISDSQRGDVILVAEGDAVPEPGSVVMLGSGLLLLLGMIVVTRRRLRT